MFEELVEWIVDLFSFEYVSTYCIVACTTEWPREFSLVFFSHWRGFTLSQWVFLYVCSIEDPTGIFVTVPPLSSNYRPRNYKNIEQLKAIQIFYHQILIEILVVATSALILSIQHSRTLNKLQILLKSNWRSLPYLTTRILKNSESEENPNKGKSNVNPCRPNGKIKKK